MKNLFKNNLIKTMFLLIAIIVGGGWVFFNVSSNESNNTQSVSKEEITTVQTKKIFPETMNQYISVSAVTKSFERVEVFPEVNGKVLVFYHSEGDYVKKGQTLARLETDQSLLTNFENARTNLKITKENQKNTEKLQKQLEKDAEGTSSEKSVKKSAKLAIDTAKSQVKIARGQVAYIQSQLDKYLIKAPTSGFINQINLDKGNLATITTPIAVISDSRRIKIETALTEFDIGKVSIGQEAEINLATYPDKKFIGKVYYVSSVADPVSKKFPVKIQLENTDGKIKAGMVANVKIITGQQKNILIIPKSAVFKEGNIEKIYVVENSRVKIKTIKTETIAEDKLKVVEGLSAGEEIIVNGNYDFKDGDLVTATRQ